MYAKLASAQREFDNKRKSSSPHRESAVVDLTTAKSGKTSHGVESAEKSKSNMVVTISSDSDSDEDPPVSLRESLRARRRRGSAKRPRDAAAKGDRRGRKDSNSAGGGGNDDVFAISDDDLDVSDSRAGGKGRKRHRTGSILADLEEDDEPDRTNTPLDAEDLHIRNLLQAAREAARMTDVATLEAEAERAAREAAAAAELEKAKSAERDRLNEAKSVQAGKAAGGKVDLTPVVLKVRCGQHTHKLRIRKSDRLLRMLVPFCKKFGLDASCAEMQVDGEPIEKDDTPLTYDLEDFMMVDVIIRKND